MSPIKLFSLLILFFFGLTTIQCASQQNVAGNNYPSQSEERRTVAQQHSKVIEITVAAPSSRWGIWLIQGPVEASKLIKDKNLQVTPIIKDVNFPEYNSRIISHIESQTAPDIGYAGPWELFHWANAEYIVPLNECLKSHQQFENISENVWEFAKETSPDENIIWGIPVHLDVSLFFYNKLKLKELGWTDDKIAQLPQDIIEGQFTLEEMALTAENAILEGIIEPGFGFWPGNYSTTLRNLYLAYQSELPTPAGEAYIIDETALIKSYNFYGRMVENNLLHEDILKTARFNSWSSRLLTRDAVSNGQVLFWLSGNGTWVHWIGDYEAGRLSLDPYEVMEVAPVPAGKEGNKGHVIGQLAYYVIFSETYTGKQNQELACELLAHAMTPEINIHHNIASQSISVLHPELYGQSFQQEPFIQSTIEMLDHIVPYGTAKRDLPLFEPLLEFMIPLESGTLTAEEAARLAIEQSRWISANELEREIIVFK